MQVYMFTFVTFQLLCLHGCFLRITVMFYISLIKRNRNINYQQISTFSLWDSNRTKNVHLYRTASLKGKVIEERGLVPSTCILLLSVSYVRLYIVNNLYIV